MSLRILLDTVFPLGGFGSLKILEGTVALAGTSSSRGAHQMADADTCRSGRGAGAGRQSSHWAAFKSLAGRLLRRLPIRAQPLGSNPLADNGRERVCTGRVIATRADIGGGEGQASESADFWSP